MYLLAKPKNKDQVSLLSSLVLRNFSKSQRLYRGPESILWESFLLRTLGGVPYINFPNSDQSGRYPLKSIVLTIFYKYLILGWTIFCVSVMTVYPFSTGYRTPSDNQDVQGHWILHKKWVSRRAIQSIGFF